MAGTLNYHQSEQWVLFKCLPNILEYHKNDSFNNIIQIMSNKPELMFNRVFACKPETADFFLSLTPLQRSFLQPQIRLFRVLPNGAGEREIAFASNFNSIEFNEIAQGSSNFNKEPGRLDGSAIKKISISEKPERPTDVNLQCKIELFFDNIVALYNTNVLELVTTPIRRDKFNSKDYRIKLMLGWNVPHDSSQLQFNAEEKKIISESNVVYLLEIIRHTINFRENGSVDLTIEYMGALESMMKNQDTFDIFNLNLVNQNIKDSTSLRNYLNSEEFDELLENEQEQLQEALENNDKLTAARTQAEIQGLASVQYTELLRERDQISNEMEDIGKKQVSIKSIKEEKNKRLDELTKRLEFIDSKIGDLEMLVLREKYAKILDHVVRTDRMFYLPISPQVFEALGSFKKTEEFTTNSNVFNELAKVKSIQLSYENQDLKNKQWAEWTGIYRQMQDLNNKILTATKEQLTNIKVEQFSEAFQNKDIMNRLYDPTNYNLYYFLLGDLINIVVSLTNTNTDINLALGPVKFGNTVLNLAQLPISLAHFSTFFVNKVIKEVKKSYFLWNFIQDIINDLVLPQMVGNNLTIATMPTLNVTNTTVLSPNKLEPGIVYNDDQLMNYLSRGYIHGQNVYSYLVIYCRAPDLPYREGNSIEDSKDGIYHFGIGRNVGIVKSVNFVKVDQPKLLDARLTGDELNRAGRILREHYNCNLSVIGNPIFIPGCHFYFDGSYLGLRGKEATDTIGLGGYYFVNGIESTFSPGKWDMQVEGWWQSMGNPIPQVLSVTNTLGTLGGGKSIVSKLKVSNVLSKNKK